MYRHAGGAVAAASWSARAMGMELYTGEAEDNAAEQAALTASDPSGCVSSGDCLMRLERGDAGELGVVNGLAASEGVVGHEDLSKPFSAQQSPEAPPQTQPLPLAKEVFERQFSEESLNSERLNEFRSQLHRLSRQKDGLMPNPGEEGGCFLGEVLLASLWVWRRGDGVFCLAFRRNLSERLASPGLGVPNPCGACHSVRLAVLLPRRPPPVCQSAA